MQVHMRIDTFSDGSRELRLPFCSDGGRKIEFRLPKHSVVKFASLALESQELEDTDIMNVGVVQNISLDELNQLESTLEETSWGKNTVKPGWGSEKGAEFIVGESGKYNIVPIDPGSMVTADPSFYRTEFDVVIIPDGELEADISPLIDSEVPIITMNPEIAIELEIAKEVSMQGDLNVVRSVDGVNYIVEQHGEGAIALGYEDGPKISVTVMDKGDYESKVVIDTGMLQQALLLTHVPRKYAFFGVPTIGDILTNDTLWTLFKRTIEWTGIGGYLTNLSAELCLEPLGWRNMGKMTSMVELPDFAPRIQRYMDEEEPDDSGMYSITLVVTTESPGMLIASALKLDVVFLTQIRTFEEGEEKVHLEFDSLSQQVAYFNVPSAAEVVRASMRLSGEFTQLRIANRSIDEADIHGVMISPEHMVAQEFKPEYDIVVPRISLHLMKIEPNTVVEVQLRGGRGGKPIEDVIASKILEQKLLPEEEYDWIDVLFSNVRLTEDVSYWIVIKAEEGRATWHVDSKNPVGGKLIFSRDGGRGWKSHHMDALFKVFYLIRARDASPRLLVGSRGDVVWHYPGVFQTSEIVPDFSEQINRHLNAMGRRGEMTTVPLLFTSGSIGMMNLTDLLIECELPTLEMKEGIEQEPVIKQMQGVLELVHSIRDKFDELIDGLDEDMQEKFKEAQEAVKAEAE